MIFINQLRLKYKPPATRLKFRLTDLSPFQHKWLLGVCPVVRERKKCFYIYDNVGSERLERYRFNRNKILYITDLLQKDLCSLNCMRQSIDAVTKVLLTLLCPSSVIIQSRENVSATLYTIYCRL